MNDTENNLERYLAAENLLNTFFAEFDYCLSECIRPQSAANGHQPVAACCQNKYHSVCDLDHPAFARLREEREKRFGKPQDHQWADPVSPCEYHDPHRGCILATHKSPICVAFMCRNGIERLRNVYGVYAYDYLGIYYALEWILTGDLKGTAYLEFRDGIVDMIEKVRMHVAS